MSSSSQGLKIAVDVMGADNGPHALIKGAVLALKETSVDVVLVGVKEVIEEELSKLSKYHSIPQSRIVIVNASQVIGMNEVPTTAFRQKKDSSVMVANTLVKEKKADAAISVGNTGAAVASSLLIGGRLKGVYRAAITALFPSSKGRTVFLDVGANVDCKPKHLLQFAIMGSVYAEKVLKTNSPRIGILNIGEEENKGNELTFDTVKLIKQTSLNFIGNIEGRDILADKADVIICDGFTGNIVLKFGESMAERFYMGLKNEFNGRSILRQLGALLVRPVVKDFLKRIDSTEYGAAPLLGVQCPCFIGHGNSSAKAMKNAIRTASEFVEQEVNRHIEEELVKYENVLNLEEAVK